MKFIERVRLIEKRKQKKTEDMTNIPDDDRELPDGPPQAGKTPSSADTAATDAEDAGDDTDEMSEPGKVDASKKRRLKKEDHDPSGGKIEMKEKADKKDKDWIQKAVNPDHEGYCTPMTKDTCTPQRKALAKTFKKMGKKRDAEVVSKKEKAAAKK